MINKSTIEDLAETWVGFQRQTWGAWLDGFSTSRLDAIPWKPLRKGSLLLTEELTNNCLKAQTDWVKAAMNCVTWNDGESLPGQVTQNMRDMVGSCMKLQQQNCESWFKAMNEINPFFSLPFERMQEAAEDLAQSWKKAIEQTLQAQEGFISALMPKELISPLMPKEPKSEIPQRVPVRTEKAQAQVAA